MKIISFIEDRNVIRIIITHLGLWLVRSRPLPKIHAPPAIASYADDSFSHAAPDSQFCGDPEYTRVPFRVGDEYIYLDTLTT